jgi:hypothetical protein
VLFVHSIVTICGLANVTVRISGCGASNCRIGKDLEESWAGHVARIGEKRSACRLLAGKPVGKRPLGRPRRRWVDSIKMDLKRDGMGWCGLDWPGLG